MRFGSSVLVSIFVLLAAGRASAELEPLLFSGQPGVVVDANGNGEIDEGDGLLTAQYDPDVDVIVFQLGPEFENSVAIFQITTRFETQVIQEVSQYPLEGPAEFTSSRPLAEFITVFLDTVELTPTRQGPSLLDQLLGDG